MFSVMKKGLNRASRSPLLLIPLYLVMNAGLTTHLWLGAGAGVRAFVPVAEMVLILLLIAAAKSVRARVGGSVLRGLFPGIAALVLAVGVVFSSAEALVQYIWGRSFVFRSDLPMVRSILLLVFGDIGAVVDVLVPLTILVVAVLVLGVSVLLVLWTERVLPRVALSPVFAGVAGVVLLALTVALPPVAGYERGVITPMVARGITDTGRLELRDISEGFEPLPAADPDDPPDSYAFPGLRDRDIHFFMIEAYGHAVFSRDRLHDELSPYLDRLAAVLEEEGYGIVSDYLKAPVFGGFSWLAEATVLTGQHVDSQPRFAELLDISRERAVPSLTRMLHEGGYYTLAVKPGTVHGSWPEGWDLFRFENSLVAHDGDFNYRGPWFSYVAVTDQHALWTTHNFLERERRSEAAVGDRPVYVHYQLVSSHTPFNRIPPYIESWDDLGDGTIYHDREEEILTFNNTWGGGTELDEGYSASIAYVLHVLTEYFAQYLDHERGPILIFMGDHQPQRPIREQDAGASVPVHIATRDHALLRALEREGYERGIRGTQPPPHAPMMDFFPMLKRIARGSSVVSPGSN
ncbi:MAG: hypothetical protein EA427_01470 [Spirochaetaceae bacterium]|nr:MAG: hypothetical protein EA427_01470 [Spirochaetaceae bacterium]